ncbi:bleomycin resistance family protein [Candidatus Poribacteria bacterium]|nr:MAG: bleomycin resistance family protein [Candidatus Poribacteria bacterium]
MSSTTTVKGIDAKVECIIPILNVKSLAASMDYYVNVLGFRVEWDWGDPPDVGSVERDGYSIMLVEGEQGHAGTWLWMGVEDGDRYYEEYKASGARIHEHPVNYPWAYEFRVEDLDGHVIRIGSGPKDNESHDH